MADTVAQLVADIRTEGGFDVDDTQALRWLNRRWRKMVGQARALRKKVTVATTTANVPFYAFSPVEAYSFELDGVPYSQGRRDHQYADSQGRLWLSGDGGLIISDADAAGVRGISLIPPPATSGLPITSFAAVLPDLLTNNPTGDALLLSILEDDFSDELVAGAVATGLGRLRRRADAAAPFEAIFAAGVEELRLRTKRRFRGPGPRQIFIQGVNA